MQDHNEYLAIHVLNESQTISYRLLSRALKLHVSVAKQCLHDFHARQNAKKSGSVHATYLLTGLRHPPSSQPAESQDDDVPMSSPYQSSQPSFSQQEAPSPAPTPTRVVLLAREADLQSARDSLDEVTGVHIYSLSPGPIRDLQTLSDCNRRVTKEYYSEDPLEQWAQYGVIQNERVWRRTRKGVAVAPPEPMKSEKHAEPAPTKNTEADDSTTSATEDKPKETAKQAPKGDEKGEERKIPALKKESSSLFKSFAKTKAPKPKAKKEQEEQDSTPALSDEEADDQDMMDLDETSEAQKPSTTLEPTKTRKDREEELRRMMEDDDDEDMADVAEADEGRAPDDEDIVDKDNGAIDKPVEKGESRAKAGEVTVENGRRRGRRRVMKKKTVKDDEGYLVTKEEPAWESFSEDEAPAPKKAKPSVMAQAAAKSAASDKGAGGKKGGKGQNSIMSFFAKK
ncbi:DNA polymerase delta subunit 3 [Sphaceloma murrayae]|uniref:DNA polymerase delta subunit 3 n=1 Tax=Sphaceloma murrayae TaxID=2082308 RepID=A0A2K1QUV1_9PEZI|nr:DNA polymerase delta subunit 3 [Sphaceloma murrayae]